MCRASSGEAGDAREQARKTQDLAEIFELAEKFEISCCFDPRFNNNNYRRPGSGREMMGRVHSQKNSPLENPTRATAEVLIRVKLLLASYLIVLDISEEKPVSGAFVALRLNDERRRRTNNRREPPTESRGISVPSSSSAGNE